MSIKPTRARSTGITVRFRNRRIANTRNMTGYQFPNQRSITNHRPSISGANTSDEPIHPSSNTLSSGITLRRGTVATHVRLLYFLQEALDIVDDVTIERDNSSN
jgi:hypothetical protein